MSNCIWYFRKSAAGQMTKYKTHSFGHIMKKMSGRIVYYITKHSTTSYYWYFLHKTTR